MFDFICDALKNTAIICACLAGVIGPLILAALVSVWFMLLYIPLAGVAITIAEEEW